MKPKLGHAKWYLHVRNLFPLLCLKTNNISKKFFRINYTKVVLVVHRDRLENWFLALTWLHGPDYCPLIRCNPGLLLDSFLDITPWEDIYI